MHVSLIASNLMHIPNYFKQCSLTQIRYLLQQGLQTMMVRLSLSKPTPQTGKKKSTTKPNLRNKPNTDSKVIIRYFTVRFDWDTLMLTKIWRAPK